MSIQQDELRQAKKADIAPSAYPDWSANYIKYRLAEAGTSLTKISRESKLHRTAAQQVFYQQYHPMQLKIAEALGVNVMEIFPSRYHPDGTPKAKAEVRRLIIAIKHNTVALPVNVYERRAA